MAVAKRQRQEKPTKKKKKKVCSLEWSPQVIQRALLASPIYIGQAQVGGDKCIKGGSLEGLGLLFCSLFWVLRHSGVEDVFSFACQ